MSRLLIVVIAPIKKPAWLAGSWYTLRMFVSGNTVFYMKGGITEL